MPNGYNLPIQNYDEIVTDEETYYISGFDDAETQKIVEQINLYLQ